MTFIYREMLEAVSKSILSKRKRSRPLISLGKPPSPTGLGSICGDDDYSDGGSGGYRVDSNDR